MLNLSDYCHLVVKNTLGNVDPIKYKSTQSVRFHFVALFKYELELPVNIQFMIHMNLIQHVSLYTLRKFLKVLGALGRNGISPKRLS